MYALKLNLKKKFEIHQVVGDARMLESIDMYTYNEIQHNIDGKLDYLSHNFDGIKYSCSISFIVY